METRTSTILPNDYTLLEQLLAQARACLILIVDDVVVFRYPTTDFSTTCFDNNFLEIIRQHLPSRVPAPTTSSHPSTAFFENNDFFSNVATSSPTAGFASSPITASRQQQQQQSFGDAYHHSNKTSNHHQQQTSSSSQHQGSLPPQVVTHENFAEILARQAQLQHSHLFQNPCEILGRPEIAFTKALGFNSFHQRASQSILRFGNLTLIVNPISNLEDRHVVESACTLVFAMEHLTGSFASQAHICKLLWDFRCGLVQSHYSTLTSSVASNNTTNSAITTSIEAPAVVLAGDEATTTTTTMSMAESSVVGDDAQVQSSSNVSLAATTKPQATTIVEDNNNNNATTTTATAEATSSSTSSHNNDHHHHKQHGSFTRLSFQALRLLRSRAGTSPATSNLIHLTSLAKFSPPAATFLQTAATAVQKDLLVSWNALSAIAHHKLGITSGGTGSLIFDSDNKQDLVDAAESCKKVTTSSSDTVGNPTESGGNNNANMSSSSSTSVAVPSLLHGSSSSHQQQQQSGVAIGTSTSPAAAGTAAGATSATDEFGTVDPASVNFDSENVIVGSFVLEQLSDLIPAVFANGATQSASPQHQELLQRMTTALLRKRLPHVTRYEADGQILEKLLQGDFRHVSHSIVLCQELVCLFHSCKQLLEVTIAAEVQKIADPRSFYGIPQAAPAKAYATEKFLHRAKQLLSLLTVGGVPAFRFPIDLTAFSEDYGAGAQRRWAGRNPSSVGFAYFTEVGPPFINARLSFDEERVFEVADALAKNVSLKSVGNIIHPPAPPAASQKSTISQHQQHQQHDGGIGIGDLHLHQQQQQQQQQREDSSKKKVTATSTTLAEPLTSPHGSKSNVAQEIQQQQQQQQQTSSPNHEPKNRNNDSSDSDSEESHSQKKGDSFYTAVSEIEGRVFPLVLRCALIDLLRVPPGGYHHHHQRNQPKFSPSPSASSHQHRRSATTGGEGPIGGSSFFENSNNNNNHINNNKSQPSLSQSYYCSREEPSNLHHQQQNSSFSSNINSNNTTTFASSGIPPVSSVAPNLPLPRPHLPGHHNRHHQHQRNVSQPPLPTPSTTSFLSSPSYAAPPTSNDSFAQAALDLLVNNDDDDDSNDDYDTDIDDDDDNIAHTDDGEGFGVSEPSSFSKSHPLHSQSHSDAQQHEQRVVQLRRRRHNNNNYYHTGFQFYPNAYSLTDAQLGLTSNTFKQIELHDLYAALIRRGKSLIFNFFSEHDDRNNNKNVQVDKKSSKSAATTMAPPPAASSSDVEANLHQQLKQAIPQETFTVIEKAPHSLWLVAAVLFVWAHVLNRGELSGGKVAGRSKNKFGGNFTVTWKKSVAQQKQDQLQQIQQQLIQQQQLHPPSSTTARGPTLANSSLQNSASSPNLVPPASLAPPPPILAAQKKLTAVAPLQPQPVTSSIPSLSSSSPVPSTSTVLSMNNKSNSKFGGGQDTSSSVLFLSGESDLLAIAPPIHSVSDVGLRYALVDLIPTSWFFGSASGTKSTTRTISGYEHDDHQVRRSNACSATMSPQSCDDSSSTQACSPSTSQRNRNNTNNTNNSNNNPSVGSLSPNNQKQQCQERNHRRPMYSTSSNYSSNSKKTKFSCPFGARGDMCIFCNRSEFPTRKRDALNHVIGQHSQTPRKRFSERERSKDDDDESGMIAAANKNSRRTDIQKLHSRAGEDLSSGDEGSSSIMLPQHRTSTSIGDAGAGAGDSGKTTTAPPTPSAPGLLDDVRDGKASAAGEGQDQESHQKREGAKDEEGTAERTRRLEREQKKRERRKQERKSVQLLAWLRYVLDNTSLCRNTVKILKREVPEQVPLWAGWVSLQAGKNIFDQDSSSSSSTSSTSSSATSSDHDRELASDGDGDDDKEREKSNEMVGNPVSTSHHEQRRQNYESTSAKTTTKTTTRKHKKTKSLRKLLDDEDEHEEEFLSSTSSSYSTTKDLHNYVLFEIESEIDEWLMLHEYEVEERLTRISQNRPDLERRGLFTAESLRGVLLAIARHDCQEQIQQAKLQIEKMKKERLLSRMKKEMTIKVDEQEKVKVEKKELRTAQEENDEEEDEEADELMLLEILEHIRNEKNELDEDNNINNKKSQQQPTFPKKPLRLTNLVKKFLGETFTFSDLDALHELLNAFDDVIFVSF